MRTIYVEYFCDEDLGDADAFYEVQADVGSLTLITAWSNNDASYRDEYMSSLFKYLGVEVKPLPKKYKKEAKKLLGKMWGLDLI